MDGAYISERARFQISYFAVARASHEFRPEGWLSPRHTHFSQKNEDDNLKASKPFIQGPRSCHGGTMAWYVPGLFAAKVLWQFDVEDAPGPQDGMSADASFKSLMFWEKPSFWVRFKPVQRQLSWG